MKYFYYPGCSLEGTAAEYDASTRAVMKSFGSELIELDDWTCCGASAGDAVSHLLSLVLPARNLALAEKQDVKADFLVPCSACYLNLRRVDDHMNRDGGIRAKINAALAEENLSYKGGIKARHLLDILVNDIGHEKIAATVKKKLSGIRVAPYYGCQFLRPYAGGDDPQRPLLMEPLIMSLGAEVHQWSMGAKCCGAGLMTTNAAVAQELVGRLLTAAKGADCIATICPMCQMNLESQQNKISRLLGEDVRTSVVYLPQLLGMALDIPENELRLKRNLAVTSVFREKIRSAVIRT